jgi:hypothetical protein
MSCGKGGGGDAGSRHVSQRQHEPMGTHRDHEYDEESVRSEHSSHVEVPRQPDTRAPRGHADTHTGGRRGGWLVSRMRVDEKERLGAQAAIG